MASIIGNYLGQQVDRWKQGYNLGRNIGRDVTGSKEGETVGGVIGAGTAYGVGQFAQPADLTRAIAEETGIPARKIVSTVAKLPGVNTIAGPLDAYLSASEEASKLGKPDNTPNLKPTIDHITSYIKNLI